MKINKIIIPVFILLFISPLTFLAGQINTSQNKSKNSLIPLKSFKHSDIGNPVIAGSILESKDGFDVTAGGADIWGVRDEFNFIYIERNGDFDIITRIESLSAPHLYTKAGIMAREDLTESCRHIYFQVFSDNKPRNNNNGGYEFQYRKEKGGEMKAIYPKSFQGSPEFPVDFPNVWVRLQRVNNDFTGYYSTDGLNWKVYTKYTLDLPGKLFLGLALTSHEVGGIARAKFSNISEITH